MPEANTNEALVPAYTLPDPLVRPDGTTITTAAEWEQERPRLLDFFTQQVYGQAPDVPDNITATLLSEQTDALNGRAIRRQIRVTIPTPQGSRDMTIALYLPKSQTKPVDIFLGLNFNGNHTIEANENLIRSTDKTRGSAAGRWPVKMLIERGYGLATIYHADISTDLSEGYQNSIFSHYYQPGQDAPADHEWGAISAWAWGLRCAMSYLAEQVPEVNRFMLIGHSRLGKAALWAAVQERAAQEQAVPDDADHPGRAALVISNNSGCMGAALSRRAFGESVALINTGWSRWLCKNFHSYNDREADLPIDQHTLISLIAPRPVYIASAQDDLWADPLGEFLGGRQANPVYALYGLDGFPAEQPPLNHSIGGSIGYHIRPGEHDITPTDWTFYLDFADKHLGQ